MINWSKAFSSFPLGFGGAAISGEGGGYGFGKITELESVSLVKSALEEGFKVFDTAPIYGHGTSEVRLGKALKKYRDRAYIVSKCGVDWDAQKRVAIRNDAQTTKRMLEESLQRLDCDKIDLYMVHWPDESVDIRRTVEVLSTAKEQGKIGAIGLCNTNDSELDLAQTVAPIDIVQNQHNLFEQVPDSLLQRLSQAKQGFMSWGTLDKGIITAQVTKVRSYDEKDIRSSDQTWWNDQINGPKIKTIEKLIPFLKDHGHSGLELALSHNLDAYAAVGLSGICLCGARDRAQLEGLVKALKNLLSPELLQEARKLAKAV